MKRLIILLLLLAGCQTPLPPQPPLPPAASPRRPMAATAAQPAPVPTTSATVQWIQDNVENVAGYTVYWWATGDLVTNTLSITNPLAQSLVISNLAIGTNYSCAMKSFGPANQQSPFSNVFPWVAKAIPQIIVITIQGSDDLLQYTDIVSWTNLPSASHEFYRSVTTRY